MSRITGVLLSILFMCKLQAQQVYFIYIQSEDRKPFYAKMHNKVISSTASGYLLVPKLQNGGHRLSIGFPGKAELGEEEFLFTIDNADQGYDLKTIPSGNGHILFNLLNYKLEYPVNGTGATAGKDTGTGNDFAGILADVVKEPGVKNIDPVKSPVTVKEPVQPDTLKNNPAIEKKPVLATEPPVVKEQAEMPKDTVKTIVTGEKKPLAEEKVLSPEEKNTQKETQGIKTTPVIVTGAVTVVFKMAGKEGSDLIFADHTNGSKDTIRIFLPKLSTDTMETTPAKETMLGVVVNVPSDTVKPVTKTDGKFLDIEVKNPNKDATPPALGDTVMPEKKPADTIVSKLVMVNTDCKKIADEDDFVKLRKKMAGEKDNDAMIDVAVKTFRQKCFTTEQVKNLSVLLMGDDGKYHFYDAAYRFVYDTNNFQQLEQQITDTYYKNRFRAMIRRN
jgi:Domain of unknown function (DUF4476)